MGEKAEGKTSGLGDALKSLIHAEETATQGWGEASMAISRLLDNLEATVKPFSKVQNAAIDLAKAVGLSSKGIMNTATRLIEQNRKMQLSMSYNISNEEMMKLQGNIFASLGRNVAIDQVGTVKLNDNGKVNENFDSALENLVAARQVFGDQVVSDIVGGFDKLGKSMKSAAKATGKLFAEAGEYGINLQKYTENFTSNLGMAQMYNFRNGVNGLKEMARKATEIRQDMKQIASFADKVGSVTGAVETAANLQVLGGSFAAMSNPLAMLNESLTDMNGLQDRFNKMTAGAARYNSVTHEIEMDPVTRQIMKRAAESMGVDPANLIDQAYAQARRGEIERQMEGIGNLAPEVAKLLPNIGEIDSETGVAGATIGGEFYKIADIANNKELQKQLVAETRSESEDIKMIAKSVMGIEAVISGKKYQLENEEARNKITEGAIGKNKTSPYDMVVDLTTKVFDEKAIEGAGVLDKYLTDFTSMYETTMAGIAARAFKPFAENNPKDFATSTRKQMSEIIGEGEIESYINDIAYKAAFEAATYAEKLSDFTRPYNYDPLNPNHTTDYKGKAGKDRELTPEDRPVARDLSLVARDVILQSSNIGTAQNGGRLFTPIQDNGQIARAAATITNGGEMTDLLAQYIEDLANGLGIEIEPVTQEGQGGTVITGNENSVPSVTVQGTNPQTYTTQNGTEVTGTRSIDYNLNLSGVLTMNVNGDNGRIGTIDLMKMLQKDDGLKRELSKVLSDAVKRIKEIGLNEGN